MRSAYRNYKNPEQKINLLLCALKGFIHIFCNSNDGWMSRQELISRSTECDVHCKPICTMVQYKSFAYFLYNQLQQKYTTQAQRMGSSYINTLCKIKRREAGKGGGRTCCEGEGEILINLGDEMKIALCKGRQDGNKINLSLIANWEECILRRKDTFRLRCMINPLKSYKTEVRKYSGRES